MSDGTSAFLHDGADEKRGARLGESRKHPSYHRWIADDEKTDHRPCGGHQSRMARENVSWADALFDVLFELPEIVIEPFACFMKGFADLPCRAPSRTFHFQPSSSSRERPTRIPIAKAT